MGTQDDVVERVARAIKDEFESIRTLNRMTGKEGEQVAVWPDLARAAIEAMGFEYEYRMVRGIDEGQEVRTAWYGEVRSSGWWPEYAERRLVGPPERLPRDAS